MRANIFKKGKLRNRLLVYFTTLAVIPMVILSIIALYLIDVSHRTDVITLETLLIDEKIEEIDKFISDTLGILEIRVGYTQQSEIEHSQQLFLLEGLLEENKAFNEVSFIRLDGTETAKLSRFQDEVELLNVSKLQHFMAASAGDTYIGDISYTLAGPSLTMTAPVRNRDADIVQLLSADVQLSELERSVQFAKLGTEGYLVLLDKNDSIISHGSVSSIQPGINVTAYSPLTRATQANRREFLDDRHEYHSVFQDASVVGIAKSVPQIGWTLLVEWPVEDANAIIFDIQNQALVFIFFSIVAVVVIALMVSHLLTRPIRTLEHAAIQIEQGNFKQKVTIKTHDELEALGDAFNKMVDGLGRLQELKNEFVFVAAHELRTPVTAIKGYLSMILDEPLEKSLPKEAKQHLEVIRSSNDRLIRLVNDLLEIARSDAGKLKVSVSSSYLATGIKSVLAEIKPLADQKKITVTYDEVKALPPVMADAERVQEVVMNFVGNALKYNNEGGKVRVWHEVTDAAVTTHVEDNGFGISEENQKHMFEKFFRAETDKTKSVKGTGLGLFITKELIEKMHGKVWLKSKEGEGSTFSFRLPRTAD